MQPNAYAELKAIPTDSPEWKRADQATREEQRVTNSGAISTADPNKIRLKHAPTFG